MNCPHCDQKVRVREEFYGKRVKCPSCDERFIVDPETEEAVPVGGASAAADERRPSRKRPIAREEEYEDEQEYDEDDGQRPTRKRRAANEEEDREGRRRSSRKSHAAEYEDEGPQEEVEEEERARRRKGKGNREAWERVRNGITLVMLGILTGVVLAILLVIGFVILGVAMAAKQVPGAAAQQPPDFLGYAGQAVYILVELDNVIGIGLCMSAPRKRGARPLAITAFSLLTLALLLKVVATGLSLMGPAPAQAAAQNVANGATAAGVLAGASELLSLVHFIVFLFFLRAVALILGRDGLAVSLVANIVLVGLMVFMQVLTVLGVLAALGGGGAAAGGAMAALGISMCLLGIVGLASACLYVVNLVRVRAAISNHLAG